MTKATLLGILASFAAAASTLAPAFAQQQPNILFIMADDMPLVPFHFTLVQNIKRDPFEQAVGIDQKTAMSIGGALGGPTTAFIYD